VANRSYLYSTDVLPPKDAPVSEKVPFRSIAEWNYDIPLCFKLLVSSNTEARRSSIWSVDEPIAFVGDYAGGVAALKRFLAQIDFPGAEALVEEAVEFLDNSENQRQHFVLEVGEIFDLSTAPMAAQAADLLKLIGSVEAEATQALASLRAHKPQQDSWLARVFGGRKAKKSEDPLMPIYKLGLGNWSNVLYFEFGET
jgi:hypothetical protein